MGRTRQTRKRHTRRKQKRKRTRHRRSTHKGGLFPRAQVLGGGGNGKLHGGDVLVTPNPLSGGGGKKYKFPTYMIADFSPGDKRARSAAKSRFEKALKSLKHKKKKSRKKRKSRKHKRRRRKR